MRGKLEVHEHWLISGFSSPLHIRHSHPGGNIPHQHPGFGPASYTIDKDEWFRETGMRGGGRKRYTTKASGEQMEWIPLEDWQRTFELHVPDDFVVPPAAKRMVLCSKMKIVRAS